MLWLVKQWFHLVKGTFTMATTDGPSQIITPFDGIGLKATLRFRNGAPVAGRTHGTAQSLTGSDTVRQEPIATVENEEAHPRTAKRWRKLPIPKMTTVIRLRRSSTPRDGAPTAVEWSHRWLVRGHWRRQRVGPGRSEIRPVWVQGHVKGPEGAPLVVSNHVYDLVR